MLNTLRPQSIFRTFFPDIPSNNNCVTLNIHLFQGTLTVLKKLKKVDPDLNPRTGLHYQSAHENGYIAFLSRNIDYIRYNRFHKHQVPTPVYGLSDSYSDEEFNYSQISGSSSLHSYPLLKRLNMILRPHTALPVLTSPEPLTSADSKKRRNIQSAFLTGNRSATSGKKPRSTLKVSTLVIVL